MALLVLSTPYDLESIYGSLGFDFNETSFEEEREKIIMGYQKITDEIEMYEIKGNFTVNNSFIHYEMISQPGMNGSPIVEDRNGDFVAVGIHTVNNQQNNQRGGIILTRPLFQHLYNWTIEIRGELSLAEKRLGLEGVKALL
jgi:V8-like Glu-specific endopeptidase